MKTALKDAIQILLAGANETPAGVYDGTKGA
jgi:hypothetical protein